jgi:protein-L-isoaspartate O-methyltransferase
MAEAEQTGRDIHGTSEREQQRLIAQASLLRDLLADNLELKRQERLLEIGCGVGAVLAQIARIEPTAQLSGLDISADQIAAARRHLAEQGLNAVELVVGDGASLPWPDAQFDRVRLWSGWWSTWQSRCQSSGRLCGCSAPTAPIHLTETDSPVCGCRRRTRRSRRSWRPLSATSTGMAMPMPDHASVRCWSRRASRP